VQRGFARPSLFFAVSRVVNVVTNIVRDDHMCACRQAGGRRLVAAAP
jgi:hypothetical protein